jgi:hypothetical protein
MYSLCQIQKVSKNLNEERVSDVNFCRWKIFFGAFFAIWISFLCFFFRVGIMFGFCTCSSTMELFESFLKEFLQVVWLIDWSFLKLENHSKKVKINDLKKCFSNHLIMVIFVFPFRKRYNLDFHYKNDESSQ